MYLGWNNREITVNSCEWEIDGLIRSILNRSAICGEIDSLIATDDGEKLNDKPDEVGAESEQFNAQQRRATDASRDWSLLFALSQHFISRIFSECTGVPANTPPASAKRRKNDVRNLFIVNLTILDVSPAVNNYIQKQRQNIPIGYFNGNHHRLCLVGHRCLLWR